MPEVKPVKKAVILAAGLGTRLLPATKAQPKEVLPLVDKPIIQYTVEEAIASGLDEIIIVTSTGKRAVEDHFDRSPELESALEAAGKTEILNEIRRISDLADVVYVRQKEQRGVGDAVYTARKVVGDDPFVLFFPDDIIVADVPVAKQMIEVYQQFGGPVIAVQKVPDSEVSSYGVIDGEPAGPRVTKIRTMVEKPSPEEAPSNLGIVGRYVLTPDLFAAIEQTTPGKGGEIQLTDGIARLLASRSAYAYEFIGRRYDTGRLLGLLKASVELALEREDIGPELLAYLRELVEDRA